jgi:hypothetical protein
MFVLRWLSFCVLLGVLDPGLVEAQLELTHPSCAPDWWDERTVAAALDVELGAEELDARIAFVVDSPCEGETIVSVLVETADGLRRRSIDVGDLPASARPRAIGMGVAALMRRPPEPGSEPPRASEPSRERDVGEADDGSTSDEEEATTETASRRGVDEPPGELPPARGDEPEDPVTAAGGGGAGSHRPPVRWELTVAGTGLWTAPGAPWVGAHGSLGWRADDSWTVTLGVDGARASASDPLGSVLGRWVSSSLALRWSHSWKRLSVGARAALALDWTRLAGRSDREGIHTQGRSRWSAAAEVAGSVGLELTERFGLLLDLGVHLSPWGLGARSPSGRVLAVRSVSGLVRLGLRVLL